MDEITGRLPSPPAAAGILIADAEGRALFSHDAHGEFASASSIKVPLVMALWADAAMGRLALDERVPVGEGVPGSGVLRSLGSVAELSLRDLATLAIVVSDNTATNRLIERIGIPRLRDRLDAWGCPRTRLERAMYDVESKHLGRDNVMTPAESVRLLTLLLRGECGGRAASDEVLAILKLTADGRRFRRFLPSTVVVANKPGWMEEVNNDVGIFWGTRPVIAAAFTRGMGEVASAELLGTVGWCAARAAGAEIDPLPKSGRASA